MRITAFHPMPVLESFFKKIWHDTDVIPEKEEVTEGNRNVRFTQEKKNGIL